MMSPAANDDGGTGTPAPHPFAVAYAKFVRTTPYVTRTLLTMTVLSYLASWIVSLEYPVACIPQFVTKGEVYRLVTSLLVNQDLFSVIFAAFHFTQIGSILEDSLGSSRLCWLAVVVFTLVTNCLFCAVCFALDVLLDEPTYALQSSAGVWTALLGLSAVEACHAIKYNPETRRKLFFWEIPVIYSPFALWALFSFFGGRVQTAYGISMLLGYTIGKGKLKRLEAPSHVVQQWEECNVFLNSNVRQQGWMMAPEATGPAAWSPENERQSLLEGILPSQAAAANASGVNQEPTQGRAGGSVFRTGNASSPIEIPSAGRALGGASQRNARAARLQALENRQEDV